MSDSVVGRTKPFVLGVPLSASSAVEHLQSILKGTARERAAPALEELHAVISLLSMLGLSVDGSGVPPDADSTAPVEPYTSGQKRLPVVLIEPLMAPHAYYFTGLIFQVHVRTGVGGLEAPPSALVGVGGRYDALLRAIWPQVPIPPFYISVFVNGDMSVKSP